MTSAARPTWSAALSSGGGLRDGSSAAPTLQTCAKDQPAHLKLKLRQPGQDCPEEIRSRDFRIDSANQSQKISSSLITGDSDVEIDEEEEEENEIILVDEERSETNHRSKSEKELFDDLSENDSDEEEDDDEVELLRELEKIRKEREAERLAKEVKSIQKNPHAVLAGNPLLASTRSETNSETNFGAKRRWDEDVVFKNQAKGLDDAPQKRFINDTTRSDFHRRFMDKFIK